MILKLTGAVCILVACGGVGFMIAAGVKREIYCLQQIISALDYMEWELNCRMTPLPQLCRKAGKNSSGCVGRLFLNAAEELEKQISPSVEQCIYAAAVKCPDTPKLTAQCFTALGKSLGVFDLSGQLKSITSAREESCRVLETYRREHSSRLNSYKTLGLCAGAALIILFI